MKLNFKRMERILLRGVSDAIALNRFPNRFEGWVRICKRRPVYRSKDGLTVLKYSGFIFNADTPLKVRVPTRDLGNGFVVQPYVQKRNTKEAMKRIIDILGYDVGFDVHYQNVGWYQGKPVMFDW